MVSYSIIRFNLLTEEFLQMWCDNVRHDIVPCVVPQSQTTDTFYWCISTDLWTSIYNDTVVKLPVFSKSSGHRIHLTKRKGLQPRWLFFYFQLFRLSVSLQPVCVCVLLCVWQCGLASKWLIFVTVWGSRELNYWRLVFHQVEIKATHAEGSTHTCTQSNTTAQSITSANYFCWKPA